MGEKYALYVLRHKIAPDDFWHLPLATLDEIFLAQSAFEAWTKNPMVEGDKPQLTKDIKQRARKRLTKGGEEHGE